MRGRCCASAVPWSISTARSFRQVPRRITLDIDDTFDAVHGSQQLRLFNAHYDDYGFQPIVVFDAEGRFVTALLRPAKRPKGVEIRAFLRRLVRAIRSHWPEVEILLRADSHYACPEVLDWCEAKGIDYVLGLAPTRTLRRHVAGLEESTAARFKAAPSGGKVRRFKEFFDAAKTWSRVRRIVARVEAGSDGTETRFIVTNLGHGSGRSLYQDLYCRRGHAARGGSRPSFRSEMMASSSFKPAPRCAATIPNSAISPRMALMVAVRSAIQAVPDPMQHQQ